jgi:hypothetical protein
MGVQVLVQKNCTEFYLYLATEGWLDNKILRDFVMIFFPFSKRLKTKSRIVCILVINSCVSVL